MNKILDAIRRLFGKTTPPALSYDRIDDGWVNVLNAEVINADGISVSVTSNGFPEMARPGERIRFTQDKKEFYAILTAVDLQGNAVLYPSHLSRPSVGKLDAMAVTKQKYPRDFPINIEAWAIRQSWWRKLRQKVILYFYRRRLEKERNRPKVTAKEINDEKPALR